VAPLMLITLGLSTLQNKPKATIVNGSSVLAIVPMAQAPVYCGTKAAIHIFSKSLRYYLDTVKIFAIIPAIVETIMTEGSGTVKISEIISPIVDTNMTEGRGKGKIKPQRVVNEFKKAFKVNKYAVNIHKVKLLRILNRISPQLADRIMKGITP